MPYEEPVIGTSEELECYLRRWPGKCFMLTPIEPLDDTTEPPDSPPEDMPGEPIERTIDPSAVPALIQALSDSYWAVRQDAASALSQIGDPRAVPALVEAYKANIGGGRWHAENALVSMGAAVVPALIEALDDENRYVRDMLVRALASVPDPNVIPALVQVLRHSSAHARQGAATALGRIGDGRVVPHILADANLTPGEMLDMMELLSHVPWRESGSVVPFLPMPPVQTNCQNLLVQPWVEQPVQDGARAVLAEIKNRALARILLRGAGRDASEDRTQLLRIADADICAGAPEEHLRPSAPPPGSQEKRLFPHVWLKRKQRGADYGSKE